MFDEPSQCPVHESTVSNLPVLAVLFTLVRQHTFMTPGTPSPILQRIELTHPQLSAAMRTDTFTFLLVVILTHSYLYYIHQFIFLFPQYGTILISAFLTWACISAMDSNMQTRLSVLTIPDMEPIT